MAPNKYMQKFLTLKILSFRIILISISYIRNNIIYESLHFRILIIKTLTIQKTKVFNLFQTTANATATMPSFTVELPMQGHPVRHQHPGGW